MRHLARSGIPVPVPQPDAHGSLVLTVAGQARGRR
jgi:Ser/Thr protein kinase RdoA (MazF antagonist)